MKNHFLGESMEFKDFDEPLIEISFFDRGARTIFTFIILFMTVGMLGACTTTSKNITATHTPITIIEETIDDEDGNNSRPTDQVDATVTPKPEATVTIKPSGTHENAVEDDVQATEVPVDEEVHTVTIDGDGGLPETTNDNIGEDVEIGEQEGDRLTYQEALEAFPEGHELHEAITFYGTSDDNRHSINGQLPEYIYYPALNSDSKAEIVRIENPIFLLNNGNLSLRLSNGKTIIRSETFGWIIPQITESGISVYLDAGAQTGLGHTPSSGYKIIGIRLSNTSEFYRYVDESTIPWFQDFGITTENSVLISNPEDPIDTLNAISLTLYTMLDTHSSHPTDEQLLDTKSRMNQGETLIIGTPYGNWNLQKGIHLIYGLVPENGDEWNTYGGSLKNPVSIGENGELLVHTASPRIGSGSLSMYLVNALQTLLGEMGFTPDKRINDFPIYSTLMHSSMAFVPDQNGEQLITRPFTFFIYDKFPEGMGDDEINIRNDRDQ